MLRSFCNRRITGISTFRPYLPRTYCSSTNKLILPKNKIKLYNVCGEEINYKKEESKIITVDIDTKTLEKIRKVIIVDSFFKLITFGAFAIICYTIGTLIVYVGVLMFS